MNTESNGIPQPFYTQKSFPVPTQSQNQSQIQNQNQIQTQNHSNSQSLGNGNNTTLPSLSSFGSSQSPSLQTPNIPSNSIQQSNIPFQDPNSTSFLSYPTTNEFQNPTNLPVTKMNNTNDPQGQHHIYSNQTDYRQVSLPGQPQISLAPSQDEGKVVEERGDVEEDEEEDVSNSIKEETNENQPDFQENNQRYLPQTDVQVQYNSSINQPLNTSQAYSFNPVHYSDQPQQQFQSFSHPSQAQPAYTAIQPGVSPNYHLYPTQNIPSTNYDSTTYIQQQQQQQFSQPDHAFRSHQTQMPMSGPSSQQQIQQQQQQQSMVYLPMNSKETQPLNFGNTNIHPGDNRMGIGSHTGVNLGMPTNSMTPYTMNISNVQPAHYDSIIETPGVNAGVMGFPPSNNVYIPSYPSVDISMFTEEDIIILKSILPLSELHKWKYLGNKLSKARSKKLSGDICCSKFHKMFNLPFNYNRVLNSNLHLTPSSHTASIPKTGDRDGQESKPEAANIDKLINYEGYLGSSIPYIVSKDGWNSIE